MKDPNTIITGFSARSRESLNSSPLISFSVKLTAFPPICRPAFSKATLRGGQSLFRVPGNAGSSSTSSSVAGVGAAEGVGDTGEGATGVCGTGAGAVGAQAPKSSANISTNIANSQSFKFLIGVDIYYELRTAVL